MARSGFIVQTRASLKKDLVALKFKELGSSAHEIIGKAFACIGISRGEGADDRVAWCVLGHGPAAQEDACRRLVNSCR